MEAIKRLKDLLYWSDRLGSEESHEIKEIIKLLEEKTKSIGTIVELAGWVIDHDYEDLIGVIYEIDEDDNNWVRVLWEDKTTTLNSKTSLTTRSLDYAVSHIVNK